MSDAIAERVRKIICDNFILGEPAESLADSDSLLDKGVIDSAGVLTLVITLEEAFGIQMHDDEVVPENLDTVARIASFVRAKTGQAEPAL